MSGPVVIVGGALANKPRNGGEAWVRLSWIRGLQRLGCEVWLAEQIDVDRCVGEGGVASPFESSLNVAWFEEVAQRFGLAERSVLMCGEQSAGAPVEALLEAAGRSDLLVNISGHVDDPRIISRCRRRAFVDIDPGFTQFWHAAGELNARLDGHDLFFTIGDLVGTPASEVPTCGLEWHHVRQPVVLDDWPVAADADHHDRVRFTTIATWRGPYGPVEVDRRRFGLKVHEFRKFLSMPSLVDAEFEAALAIHPDERPDIERLAADGWTVLDPAQVAGSPEAFRSFVADSGAEFSVAQGIYVETRTGWFSDRSVRYLAAGRPVLVQDTGFSTTLPTGKGLVAFADVDQARLAATDVIEDYDAHRVAARDLAESIFDSDVVLPPLLETCLDGGR